VARASRPQPALIKTREIHEIHGFFPRCRVIATRVINKSIHSIHMKTNPRHGHAAFTLIELLAVITIIVILAGLVVAGMGYVNERQAKEKTKVQLAILAKALEDFKLDNGAYPPLIKITDGSLESADNADIFNSSGATNKDSPGLITQSKALYKALFWDTDYDGNGAVTSNGSKNDADQKIYLPELNPGTANNASKLGWNSTDRTYIIDPWGNPYVFQSAMNAPQGTGANKTANPNDDAINPDFDLWSMGKDGKTNEDSNHKDCKDDIKAN
jgi:general secretion pathway protein G